jgi:palmitoyl-protein thioesterase
LPVSNHLRLPPADATQFGTPHLGISALIPCPTPPTLSCLLAARAARSGIYTSYAQSHLIQAQYFRDSERLDTFLSTTTFVRDLNAEGRSLAPPEEGRSGREKGGEGLKGLENLVAVMFDMDRESAYRWLARLSSVDRL